MLKDFDEVVVGDRIQFLDRFALHIRLAGCSQNIDQSGTPEILRNELPDKTHLRQKTGKLTGRSLVLGLSLEDKPA